MNDQEGKKIPASIARVKAHAHKIRYYDDERTIGNTIIIDLKPGWRWTLGDVEHVQGFDRVADILRMLSMFTAPCDCQECL